MVELTPEQALEGTDWNGVARVHRGGMLDPPMAGDGWRLRLRRRSLTVAAITFCSCGCAPQTACAFGGSNGCVQLELSPPEAALGCLCRGWPNPQGRSPVAGTARLVERADCCGCVAVAWRVGGSGVDSWGSAYHGPSKLNEGRSPSTPL